MGNKDIDYLVYYLAGLQPALGTVRKASRRNRADSRIGYLHLPVMISAMLPDRGKDLTPLLSGLK
jgi:hypothetical protein